MSRSRRDFLKTAGWLGALPASWTAFAHSVSAAARNTAPTDTGYWDMVVRQFPLEDGLIYLHAANVCPASRPVMDRHLKFLSDFHGNPSFQNRAKYAELQEQARTRLAQLMGVTADEIAITRNTSEATNTVVAGIDLKAGDEVLITSHNHPSNNHSWKVRAKREGFVVKEAPVPVPAKSRQELLDGIERLIGSRTRVIAVTHLTNTAGLQYPVREIGRMAAQRNIWFHVDGAQTFGALAVNLREMGCDSYAASAHKWAMGPLEEGLLYVKASRIPELWPAIVTAGWQDDLKGARKFEVYGQRDDPRIAAFGAAAEFLELIGMPAVEARMRYLASYLKKGLSGIGAVQFRTNLEEELSGGVVKFSLQGRSTKMVHDTLWEKHRVAGALTAGGETEGVRLCPHIYNTTAQLDEVVAGVKKLA
jgi:isopenicillin-N epimerase